MPKVLQAANKLRIKKKKPNGPYRWMLGVMSKRLDAIVHRHFHKLDELQMQNWVC